MLKMSFKILSDIKKSMDKEAQRTRRAMVTAVKVEAFRLRKEGKDLLETGRLGLEALNRPALAAKASGRRPYTHPFEGFARGFLYRFDRRTLSAHIGFVGTGKGTRWMKKFVRKAIPGYFWTFTPEYELFLRNKGVFLRKETKGAQVPPRDIIKTFLAHEGEDKIMRNIEDNFERKMRGERI